MGYSHLGKSPDLKDVVDVVFEWLDNKGNNGMSLHITERGEFTMISLRDEIGDRDPALMFSL